MKTTSTLSGDWFDAAFEIPDRDGGSFEVVDANGLHHDCTFRFFYGGFVLWPSLTKISAVKWRRKALRGESSRTRIETAPSSAPEWCI